MKHKKILILALILSLSCIMTTAVMIQDAQGAEANLSWGSTGQSVTLLQNTLNRLGYWCGNADGVFGPNTYQAVTRFQRSVGITVDGIVGPQTRTYLGMPSSSPANQTVSRGGSRVMTVLATGYCSCAKCNWPYGGKPSYLGYPLKRGIIAVDPNIIPMGSRLYVEGYGEGIAADQGGAIKGRHIDLCFSSHQEALNWGKRTVKVTIY